MRKTMEWELRLYVAGETLQSKVTLENLDSACEARLKGRYHLEVIDIKKNPQKAIDEQIFAIPTLVRVSPLPYKILIGNLLSIEKAIASLDIKTKKDY